MGINNVLMFSFEGIMKLMTENSQEKTERSEVFTGCSSVINFIIPEQTEH